MASREPLRASSVTRVLKASHGQGWSHKQGQQLCRQRSTGTGTRGPDWKAAVPGRGAAACGGSCRRGACTGKAHLGTGETHEVSRNLMPDVTIGLPGPAKRFAIWSTP